MTSDPPAGDLLSAALVKGSEGRFQRARRVLEVIVNVLSIGVLPIRSRPVSDVHQPTGVVVRWRGTGREVLRVGSHTVSQAQQLLAYINAQLEELSVEQFCERWEVESLS
jgi:hypothetical protein